MQGTNRTWWGGGRRACYVDPGSELPLLLGSGEKASAMILYEMENKGEPYDTLVHYGTTHAKKNIAAFFFWGRQCVSEKNMFSGGRTT